jgi:hypothetical protein
MIMALNLIGATEPRSMPHCRGRDTIGLQAD